MPGYLIQGETLTGIADAIRGKTGGIDPILVSDMAGEISAIEGGGGGITMQADGFLPVSSDAVAHSGAIIMNATAVLVE